MFKLASWLSAPARPAPNNVINIRLGNHGVVFVRPTARGQDGELPPRDAGVASLKGDVVIALGDKLRIRGIRFVLRGYYVMDMGPARKGETDIFFEVEVYPQVENHLKSPPDGRLRCGLEFSLAADLPATDDTAECRVCYILFAQALGNTTVQSNLPRHLTLSPPVDANIQDEGGDWPNIEHSLTAFVPIHVVHGAGPMGYTALDEIMTGFEEGPGIVQCRCTADVFSIGSQVQISASVPDFAPGIELKSFSYHIHQKQTLTSPRDQQQRVIVNTFTLCNTKIEQEGHSWSWQTSARIPSAGMLRPSTLPRIDTPIKLEHSLVSEFVYHYQGQKMTMRRSRPTILPSCTLIPENLDVPLYDAPEEFFNTTGSLYTPCLACGRTPIDNLCEDTPADALLRHVKHDESNECQVCRFKEIDLSETEMKTTAIDHADPKGFKCACKLRGDRDEAKKYAFHETSDPDVGLSRKLKGEDEAVDHATPSSSG